MLDVALVIGRSESGKTTLAKSLLEKQEKPVRVVNDSSGDLDPGWETCNWSDLERLEGVAVLVEDVVAATQTEFAHLQRLLSVGCHHRSVGPVYILCHSLQKNNLQGLVQYLNRVIFTASKTNVDSIAAALNLARFPRQSREEYTKVFLACKEPYAYFTLDLDKRTFGRGPSLDEATPALSPPGKRVEARAAIDPPAKRIDPTRFFQQMSDPERASLIYDLVLPHLRNISSDYSVKVFSRKNGQEMTVSLLDYLDVATDESRKPNEALRRFHKFLLGKLALPSCLVVNKHLRG